MAKKIQVLEAMPETFKTAYPSTRCIIDCTKTFSQTPLLLSSYGTMVNTEVWFDYLHLEQKSFISEFYSQKEIFIKSLILSKNPKKDNDSIIEDCGCTIEKEFEPLNMK